MKRTLCPFFLFGLFCCLAVVGCGGSSSPTLTGTVTLEGSPVPDAEVVFEPTDKEKGKGGDTVRTDASGKFMVESSSKKAGLKPGKYNVWVSKWVRKDGSSPPPEELEMEKASGVMKNALPPKYSNRESGTAPFTVEIKTGKNEPLELKLAK